MMSTEQVPFCQRNVRSWVTLLVASGALVLGFAIWLAMKDTGSKGLGFSALFDGSEQPAEPPKPTAHAPPATPAALTLAGQPDPAALQLAGWQNQPAAPAAQGQAASPALQLQSAFNQAADVIRPSVVNINAIRPSLPRPARPAQAPQFVDPFDGIPDKVFGKLAYESVGSGVIIDPAGYVVTNNHLVGQATAIMVTRYNHANEHLPARLVSTDPRNDLALIKLEKPGRFTAARFADSSKVEVGDWVLAVGNPFGLGHTVTSGIVSGRRPSLVIGGVEYRGLIQTDAPINQGSSGGPLVNLTGEVVGINTAIYAPTGVSNGTGFAIPANRVTAFVARALGKEQQMPVAQIQPVNAPAQTLVVQPWLGVYITNVTPQLAAKLSLPRAGGVFVNSVTPGSPASSAEIRRGDVIIALAGVPVQNTVALNQVSARLPANQKVYVVVWRKGKPKRLKLKIRGP
jgi:serine protease Do